MTLFLFFFCSMAGAAEKVSIQLAWNHQFQFAGYYAALHRGYYSKEGLDVTIIEGGTNTFAREAVAGHRAQYGVAGAELMLHRIDGDPFVVLAPIFQHSATILLARRDSGISTIHDLMGKRVMLLPGKKDADILVAFLNEGIPISAIERMDQTYNLNDLIQGRTHAVSAYTTNEPWQLLQNNIEPVIISPRTYGIDFYSDCLFTTHNEIKHHPRQVKAFLEASLKGWAYAMDHPEEIIDLLISHYHVKKSRGHLRYEAQAIRKIMRPDLIQIGHMNPGRWRHIAKTYRKLGLLTGEFPFDDFLYDPNHTTDATRLKRIAAVAVGICMVFIVVILTLYFFNRKLANEIRERKKVEKNLREREQLLNEMGSLARIGGWVHDLVENRATWTKEIYKIIEIDDSTVPPGPNEHLNYYPPRDREMLARAYDLSMETGEKFDIKLQCHTASDRLLWVHAVGRPEYANGECIKMKGIFQDITKQKEIETQLLQAQKMEAVGRLAGGVAHDFNNMLSIILGNAEILLEDMPPTDPLTDNVKEIHKATKRSANLTRQLLAFARKQAIAPRILDINQVLEEMLKMLQRLIGEDIELSWIPGQGIWPVRMDPSQVDQLLANLCLNARDAIEDIGRVTIETDNVVFNADYCRDHMGFHPGEFVMIVVSDNGAGMDKETRENLFEPFFTTKSIGRGSGLGLATVFGIVKQNKGFINVYSEPGKGSTFKLYLPASGKSMPPEPPKNMPFSPQSGDETVLLVEDEPPILKIAQKILEQLGYTVLATHSPDEALKMAGMWGKNTIHLLITDVIMPGMNGRELSERLCRLHPDMKCIFMSGYTANVIARHGVLDKGVHFINKPFSRQDLAQSVREALGHS